jgi:hypothetical protein
LNKNQKIQEQAAKIQGQNVTILNLNQKIQGLEQQQRAKEIFKKLAMLVVSTLVKVGIKSFICNQFDIKGDVGFSLLGLFNLKGSNFVKCQIGDRNIMQNLERIVSQ